MMCLTSADALSRYAFNRPIMGAYEITEKYLMVAAIFLGLSYGYRGGLFIRVTFLVDRLPGAARLAADYFAFLVTLAFCVVFLWATARPGLSRPARGHRAEHTADPGRAGLLPGADRLSRAHHHHARRPAACAAPPVTAVHARGALRLLNGGYRKDFHDRPRCRCWSCCSACCPACRSPWRWPAPACSASG